MEFIKALVKRDNMMGDYIEYFNLDKIITIHPIENTQYTKILMGAGLYWDVYTDTIEIVNITEIIKNGL